MTGSENASNASFAMASALYWPSPQTNIGLALFRHKAFLESDKRRLRKTPSLSERLHIDNCSTCKACTANCPKGVEVFDEGVLALMRRMSLQEHGLTEMQKGYFQTIHDRGSLFTPFRVPLSQQLPEVNDPKKAKDEVVFFHGCMMNMRYQEAGKAIVHILTSLGIRVHLPKDLVCFGGPLLWTGQDGPFAEISQKNIQVFERVGASTLVVGCAGCGMTLKKDYGECIKGQKPFVIYDFTEHLERLKPSFESHRDRIWKVTYHDPCHLRRGQGIWKEPRRLLKSFPNLRFIEMEKSDQCCGGMLATHNRVLANALSKKRAKTLMEAEVDIVTTECLLCKDMILKALKKENSPIAVYSVAELIEKLYYSKQTP